MIAAAKTAQLDPQLENDSKLKLRPPDDAMPLAYRPREAAKQLGIGTTTLWEQTQPRGPIPCVRIGTAVRYPAALLESWLNSQAAKELK